VSVAGDAMIRRTRTGHANDSQPACSRTPRTPEMEARGERQYVVVAVRKTPNKVGIFIRYQMAIDGAR